MKFIRQGATHKVVLGPAVAVANGYVPVTSLTLSSADEAEVILHDNGTVVDISGYTWAAITTADGYYHLTLQSGISGTVGHVTVVVNDDSLCLPLREDFTVLEEAVYDALFAASAPGYVANAPVNVAQVSGDGTAADNLETAALAYSATRGLAGTALPAVAAGGAGGLPTDSTGKTSFNDIAATAVVSAGAITTSSGAVSNVTTVATTTNVTNAPTSGDLTAVMKASVNTEVDSALNTDVPGSPVAGSINERIKTMDDADIPGRLPAALTANGNIKASLVEILTTALTETSGLIAAGFKKFFNVATPTGTVNSLPDAVAGASGGVFIAGTNAATTVTTALTTTFTGNLTGNVGGNVTGSVGSLVGHTVQTGDNFARLGAPVGASISADIAAVQADLPQRITKNTALAGFPFAMVLSSDHVTGATGLTVTATRSLDGAAFGACANAVAEIANGVYKIDLAAGDLNANTVTLKFSAATADTRIVHLVTQNS